MTHRSRLFAMDVSEQCVYSFHTLVTREGDQTGEKTRLWVVLILLRNDTP